MWFLFELQVNRQLMLSSVSVSISMLIWVVWNLKMLIDLINCLKCYYQDKCGKGIPYMFYDFYLRYIMILEPRMQPRNYTHLYFLCMLLDDVLSYIDIMNIFLSFILETNQVFIVGLNDYKCEIRLECTCDMFMWNSGLVFS